MSELFLHPFEPLVDDDSQFLILGTFPSLQSFENNFYYGHPRNQFWKILEVLFEVSLKTNEEKALFCQKHHIALWDIFSQASRSANNSSDTNLGQTTVNDITAFLKSHPKIKRLFFTSKSAYKAYRKNCKDSGIPVTVLPSPSPAFALLSFEAKVGIYKKDFYHTIFNL